MRFLKASISTLLAGAISLLASGCAQDKKESKLDGQTVRVQVPMQSTEGEYRLEIVELSTVQDLTSLKGLAARFLIDPINRAGRLTGRPPEIRYIRNRDGVVVAKDNLSLQLLTVYAHFERLKIWDEKVGAQNLLKYPRTVAVNALFKSEDGGVQNNNALYLGQYDALMIQPYSKEALPLMVNAGVIGHEHFHSLFQKIVIEPFGEKFMRLSRLTAPADFDFEDESSPEEGPVRTFMSGGRGQGESSRGRMDPEKALEMRKRYHAALLRGVNEGLADVWGWVYSGDDSFVGRTLPQEKNRSLEQTPDFLYGKDKLWGAIERGFEEKSLITLSYQYGTQLARSLRQFARIRQIEGQLTQEEIRVLMGRSILLTLPEIKKRYETLKSDEVLTLSHLVGAFGEVLKNLSSKECQSFTDVMTEAGLKESGFDSKCPKPDELSQP